MSECFGSNHYFALFGVPVAFDVDKVALKAQLLALQKAHHPDSSSKESDVRSDLINHAFATLVNDDLRAIYLLELAGIAINLDSSIGDIDFLSQMMDSHIVLEESDNPKVIDDVRCELDRLGKELAQTFAHAYTAKDWTLATQTALKLKFLAKLQDDTQKNVPVTTLDDDDLYV